MAWSDVFPLLRKLKKDQFISDSRRIMHTPPYLCKSERYNYNEEGFEVKIGKSSKIKIPISMLKVCYEEALKNSNFYNRSVLSKYYPIPLKDHGCHVHAIGQIFVAIGVAELIDKNTYLIKK